MRRGVEIANIEDKSRACNFTESVFFNPKVLRELIKLLSNSFKKCKILSLWEQGRQNAKFQLQKLNLFI